MNRTELNGGIRKSDWLNEQMSELSEDFARVHFYNRKTGGKKTGIEENKDDALGI